MTTTFGLTGGIGTGKSTVARLLRERGIPVVDADQSAREVVAPGSEGLAEIAQVFGASFLLEDGSLDRAAMRAHVIRDDAARKRLEQITHPRIFLAISRDLRAHAEAGATLMGVEAALMVETGSYKMYDALVVVSCSPDTQLARVIARDGVDEADAKQIIATQAPLADKEAVADHVVRNDGSLADLERAVATLVDELRR
jgi:dephospho-CoA kinase